MRLPWRRNKAPQPEPVDPWQGSPFNTDVIKPGDPGWEIWEQAQRTGEPVIGEYTPDGKITILNPDCETDEDEYEEVGDFGALAPRHREEDCGG